MAITNAIMQMRRGNEADFDPDKMHPGEWAVSTDEKYVRMCFSPGVCVRMATYEAFEEDMEQIISILEEANTVKEAIEEIYKEFQEAELDIEAAENAAILSESYAKGGTGTREGEDTDNAKYYADLAKENIEPVMNAVSDIALNRQTLGYSKKNLLKLEDKTDTANGVTFTSNANSGTVVANGTSINGGMFLRVADKIYLKAGTYKLTGCPSDGQTNGYRQTIHMLNADDSYLSEVNDYGDGGTFTITQEMVDAGVYVSCTVYAFDGCVANNLTFRTMVRLADIEDDTFEPYVDDVDTRFKALTPVNNLAATVAGKPLDAVQGKALNDRIATLEDAFINYYVSLINGWIGTLVVSVNKINRQVSITGFIDGTNATDTVFAKANIEDNGVPVPVNAISLIVQQGYNNAFVTIGFSNSGNGWEAKAPSISHVYQFSTGYIMSN